VLLLYPLTLVGLPILWRLLPEKAWRRVSKTWAYAAAIYPLLLLGLMLIHAAFPRRSGYLALSQALAPYLFLPLLLLLPFGILRHARVLRWSLAACAVVFLVRFGWNAPAALVRAVVPDHPHGPRVEVLNWNTQNSPPSEQQARVRQVLATKPAGIVVLEETYWEWMRDDPLVSKLYPYQFNHTIQASSGLVLLSSYPVLAHGVAEIPRTSRGWPRLVWARVDVGDGKPLLVVAAHPESPYSSIGDCRFPRCYDTSRRDSLLPHIREVVDPALRRGERVLVSGDMNTTDREPAYSVLSRGLQDAQRRAGSLFGATWGMVPQLRWSLPLLRIDYLFSSPNVVPARLRVDCAPRGSDHCMLHGSFELR
jgi:endonuclease/exonuclease/phosphatase family metal-dependent hydrolase